MKQDETNMKLYEIKMKMGETNNFALPFNVS
jgi:hypothetical protein